MTMQIDNKLRVRLDEALREFNSFTVGNASAYSDTSRVDVKAGATILVIEDVNDYPVEITYMFTFNQINFKCNVVISIEASGLFGISPIFADKVDRNVIVALAVINALKIREVDTYLIEGRGLIITLPDTGFIDTIYAKSFYKRKDDEKNDMWQSSNTELFTVDFLDDMLSKAIQPSSVVDEVEDILFKIENKVTGMDMTPFFKRYKEQYETSDEEIGTSDKYNPGDDFDYEDDNLGY